MRVLALDYGEARCGLAICDPSGTIVTPLAAVERAGTRRGVGRLLALVHQYSVEHVVIGLPLTLAGEEGLQALETHAFAERLAAVVAVPVTLHDERLTTSQARRGGGSADLDSRAAAHLLEAFLAEQARVAT